MCISYRAPTPDTMEKTFSAPIIDQPEWHSEVWQDYLAPIILGDGDTRVTRVASYGIVPQKRKPPAIKRLSTMNARSETVGEKRSYSKAWREGQLCLVPCIHFYEPKWFDDDTVHVRHRIGLTSGEPFAVAGIWREWPNPDGNIETSFTQLTMNADDHPFMKQFHKSNDEKRSLVIIPQTEWDDWLGCKNPEEARSFIRDYPAELMVADPAPLPPRSKKNVSHSPDVDQGLLL